MRLSARALPILLLALAARTHAFGEDVAPVLTNLQVTDCRGNFSTSVLSISTGRPSFRINVQDAGDGMDWGHDAVLEGGLSTNVMALHFDETGGPVFTDKSGHGNNGNDGSTTGTTPGPNAAFGNARSFAAGNQVLVAASQSINVATMVTVQAWINPNAISAMPIVEWNSNPGDGVQFWVGDPAPTNDLRLFANVKSTAGSSNIVQSANNVVSTGTWQHVALTYNQNTAILYHNGVLVASSTLGPITPLATDRALYIGRRPSGAGADTFEGSIDEVIVTSLPLSAAAIANAYHSGNFDYTAGTNTLVRILLATGTPNSYYGPNQPGSSVDPATGTVAVTTVTVFNVDLIPGSANSFEFSFRDRRGATRRLTQNSIQVIIAPPSVPNGFAGSPTQTYSVDWSWLQPERLCLFNGNPSTPGLYKVKNSATHVTLPTGDNLPGLTFTETGLSTNTIYSRKVSAFDSYGEGPLSPSATVYTLAAPPINATAASVSTGSLILGWDTNENPSYTRYEVTFWDSSFSTAQSSAVSIGSNHTASTAALSGLSAGTTYYLRVRAKNGRSSDGFGDSFTAFLSTTIATLPGAPSGLTATIDSATQITWSWPAAPTALSYTLINENGGAVLAQTTGLSAVISGLPVNQGLTARLRVNNGSGQGQTSSPLTAFTNSNPPTGTTTTHLSTSSITVSWSANGNPSNTTYQAFKATDTGFGGTVESVTVTETKANFLGLLPGTTYYFRVRSVSLGSNPSAFDAAIERVTNILAPISQSQTPQTPYQPVSGSAALFHFDEGAGTVVFDSSTFGNNGTLTCGFVNCSSPTYTTGKSGLGTAANFTGIQNTLCEVPDASQLNTGSSLSLEAWVNPASAAQTPEATIVAKGSGTYEAYGLDIKDGKARFFIRDNDPVPSPALHAVSSTQSIPAGRWTHIVGVYKPPPGPSISVYVDGILSNTAAVTFGGAGSGRLTNSHALSIGNRKTAGTNYDKGFLGLIDEVHIQSNQLSASQVLAAYQAGASNELQLPAPNANVRLLIPPNAFEGDATISVSSDPIGNPIRVDPQTVRDGVATPPAGSYMVSGTLIELVASKSGVALPSTRIFASSVSVSIDYPDADSNLLVDGTNPAVPVTTLSVYTLNETVGQWEKLASSVDTANKRVTGITEHFSVFAIFGPSTIQPDTDSALVYPSPWKPGSGGRFDSATFSGKTGLAIANLTAEGSIRIFTFSGEHVATLDYAGKNAGTVIWDGKNSSGRDVASGVYFAYIKPSSGKAVVVKFAIER